MKALFSSCLVCGALVLTSCAPVCPGVQPSSSRVRIVHASPDASAVDVCVNGEPAFQGAEFASVTDYARLVPGTYAVRVTAAGAGCSSAGVIDASLTLSAGQDVSVVATNVLSQIEPVVLIDDNAPPASGRAKVRFVHASPNAPAVHITLPDGTTLFDNIAFKQASSYREVAAGKDNDCDGQIDEGTTTPRIWYRDADGDGYGNPSVTTQAVKRPSGYVANDDDCDDTDSAVHPGAPDCANQPDGIDNNCNGQVDEDQSCQHPPVVDRDGDGVPDDDACPEISLGLCGGTGCGLIGLSLVGMWVSRRRRR